MNFGRGTRRLGKKNRCLPPIRMQAGLSVGQDFLDGLSLSPRELGKVKKRTKK